MQSKPKLMDMRWLPPGTSSAKAKASTNRARPNTTAEQTDRKNAKEQTNEKYAKWPE